MNFPDGQYAAIEADPAWSFATRSEKGRNRCPERLHYQTMSLDQIKALPVERAAAKDCALFLWAIDPMIPHAMEVAAVWGFAFKTVAFYWAKTAVRKKTGEIYHPIGTGYWTRANPEQCLLFTRGKPKRLSKSVRKLIEAPRREHSRKPDEAHERIEQLVGGPYLELFARERRPGWTSWGNQLPVEAA